MIGVIIIGALLIILGLFCVITGKIPFIKKYHSVKKTALHARIEGSAVLLVGILFVFQYFMPMGIGILILLIWAICILAFILEIAGKAI